MTERRGNMNLPIKIVNRLSSFFNSYQEKANFLKALSRQRKADELILLACCYLDQLGSCLFPQTGSSKRSFELTLLTHSGERDEFNLISVADLAADVLWMVETISMIVPKPGRLEMMSEDNKPLLKFIDQTGVSLTEKFVARLLKSLHDVLKYNFRVHIKQTKNKESYGEEGSVIDSIMKLREKGAEIKEENIRNLIREYKYTSILYREYRSKAVHEAAGIYVNPKKFWKMTRPYFVEVVSPWFTSSALKLEFPAIFITECLQTCIECGKRAIIGKGLLPPRIWNAICDIEELDLMDVEGVEEAKPIKLKIE